APKIMRYLRPFLCEGIVLGVVAASGLAQSQATRPEPPNPEPVIPAAVFPGLDSPPATAPGAPARPQGHDPLLDLPPLPPAQVTLIGGTVTTLNEVMNQMAFLPFGTKKEMRVHFDTRTRFFRDGAPISEREIKQGQRVYLDTMLNGDRVFAKTIWIQTLVDSGVGQGQIVDFDDGRQVLTVRDELSSQPLTMRLSPATVIRKGEQPAS